MKVNENKLNQDSKTEHKLDFVNNNKDRNLNENVKFLLENNKLRMDGSPFLMRVEHDDNSLRCLDLMLAEYIWTKFTVTELYLIFSLPHEFGYIMSFSGMEISKRNVIDLINSTELLSPKQKQKLKRKVWDTNHIMFLLIMDFINRYQFFNRDEYEISIA